LESKTLSCPESSSGLQNWFKFAEEKISDRTPKIAKAKEQRDLFRQKVDILSKSWDDEDYSTIGNSIYEEQLVYLGESRLGFYAFSREILKYPEWTGLWENKK
jgi:hypothetical protein